MKHTEEDKEKMLLKIREFYKNNKNPNDKRVMVTCKYCKEEFLGHNKRIVCSLSCKNAIQQKEGTYIEMKIEQLLQKEGIQYVKQFKLGKRFLFDFHINNTKLLIECDGEYWHSLPKRIKLDKEKDEYAIERGYKVIRLKEKEINENLENCKMIIKGGN